MTTLFTIGYQDADADRCSPRSKAPAWRPSPTCARSCPLASAGSPVSLRESLDAAGIDYRHFRDLGTPAAGRQAARAGDAAGMRRVFCEQLATDAAQAALGELEQLAGKPSDLPVMLLPRSGRVPPPRDRRGVAAAGLYGDGLVRLR